MGMAEAVTFAGFHGDTLEGRWHEPSAPLRGALVLAHCFTCSKDLTIVSRLATHLSDRGFAVLRFDFTGLGESEGAFEQSTFAANIGDLVRAALWTTEQTSAPLGLIGHSLGGAAVLTAAPKIRPVRAIAIIGAPASAKHVANLIEPDVAARAQIEGCAFATIAGRTFPISKQFLDDLDRFDSTNAIGASTIPTMILHSPEDSIVPVEEGERIFGMLAQPKAFVPLVGADHLLTDADHIRFAGERLATWFGERL